MRSQSKNELNLFFQVYNFVCQDFGFRLDQLKDALIFTDAETEIYPIWLCPTRHVVIKGMEHMSIFKKDDVHVDIGIYGFVVFIDSFSTNYFISNLDLQRPILKIKFGLYNSADFESSSI